MSRQAAADLGVVEEQLEEIAHPIEEQRIARLGLEAMILRHHRRLLGRASARAMQPIA